MERFGFVSQQWVFENRLRAIIHSGYQYRTDIKERLMDHEQQDGGADAFAVVAIITIVVGGIVFWLSNMPS